MYDSLEDFINLLDKKKQILKITEYVNPILEISEITDRFSKTKNGGKALIFFNTGTKFPVVTNIFGSDERMALALGLRNLNEAAERINEFLRIITQPKKTFLDKIKSIGNLKDLKNIFPKTVKKGSCQEVIIKNPNLNILPVLKTWPQDGGKFITLPIVHTIDPKTGIRNVGMYRMQIFDSQTTGMHWHKHKVGARHFEEYKRLNKKMPVAVALGGDPVYTYCATAPLPDGVDEYLLAGFLRNKPVKLVKCITQDIEVPADADIIIEGYIDPNEDFVIEGPFGDHTGFYSLADYYPKFHVTCITHKKNAIYPATIVGIPPQEDAYIAKATEKIFLPLIQKSIAPEIIDMHLPEAGVAHNFTIIKIKKRFPGHVEKVVNSLWGNGQMALNKMMFITDDENLDITNYHEFISKSLQYFRPDKDLIFAQGPLDVLDHSSDRFIFGSKVAFDLTKKNINPSKNHNKIDIEKIKQSNQDIKAVKNLYPQYPILILAIEKNQPVKKYIENLKNIVENTFKIIIFTDKIFDINDLYLAAWIVGSNTDPKRDFYIEKNEEKAQLWIDATAKNKDFDNFKRQWPDIILMDEKTIKKIDKKWQQITNENFIMSPSNKFLNL